MSKVILFKCDRYNCYNRQEVLNSTPPGWAKLEVWEAGVGKQEGQIMHNQMWLCPACVKSLHNSVGVHPTP